MRWTTAVDLREQVQNRWDKGELLAQLVPAPTPDTAEHATPMTSLFPWRLRLQSPSSSDLANRFDEVRAWIQAMRQAQASHGWRIAWRDVNHRVVGSNPLPDSVWLDSLDDALAVLGKQTEAQRFLVCVTHTLATYPGLRGWLVKNPMKLLALDAVWLRLLAIVAWVATHPRPGIYLRQVSVPGETGIDSKLIESHRAVLAELLDIVLPADAIDTRFSGVGQFASRYGFRDKPLRIRFRVLDPALALVAPGTDQDIALTQAAFRGLSASLGETVQHIFFTENEVNFLAFPPVTRSLVIFGAGYGFEVLEGAAWLQQKLIYYWGDIDTHGFAILDQLRAHVPHVQSLLMDRETLMAHRDHWGNEPQPQLRDLPRLDPAERELFDDLRYQRVRQDSGASLRLEQERIDFAWVQRVLERLA